MIISYFIIIPITLVFEPSALLDIITIQSFLLLFTYALSTHKTQSLLFLFDSFFIGTIWQFIPPYLSALPTTELFSARIFILSSLISLVLIQSLVISNNPKIKQNPSILIYSIVHSVGSFAFMYFAMLAEISVGDERLRLMVYHVYMWKLLALSLTYFSLIIGTVWVCLLGGHG